MNSKTELLKSYVKKGQFSYEKKFKSQDKTERSINPAIGNAAMHQYFERNYFDKALNVFPAKVIFETEVAQSQK